MRNFVTNLLVPYFVKMKIQLGLPMDQFTTWLIDCWSVHLSVEFLTWMRDNHPTIIINFVPARMTGEIQPADVGIQRLFKHSMKQTAHQDVVKEVMTKHRNGTLAEDVSIDSKLSVLRDRTVHWMWRAYQTLNTSRIVLKGQSLLYIS